MPHLTQAKDICENSDDCLGRTYSKHTGWPKYIKDIEECLNKIPHASTGQSPYEIIHGKAPTFMLDHVIKPYVPLRHSRVPDPRMVAKEVLFKEAKRRQRQQKGHIYICQVDDLVLLKTNPTSCAAEGVAKKFHLLYEGPYRVIGQPFKNVYKISHPHSGVIKGNFNIRNLRPYYSGFRARQSNSNFDELNRGRS